MSELSQGYECQPQTREEIEHALAKLYTQAESAIQNGAVEEVQRLTDEINTLEQQLELAPSQLKSAA